MQFFYSGKPEEFPHFSRVQRKELLLFLPLHDAQDTSEAVFPFPHLHLYMDFQKAPVYFSTPEYALRSRQEPAVPVLLFL